MGLRYVIADDKWTTATSTTNSISWGDVVTASEIRVSQGKNGEINAGLYMRYVKSKLTKLQLDKLKARMKKLQKMIKECEEIKQVGVFEQLKTMLAVVIRESEAVAFGVDTVVHQSTVDKFKSRAKNVQFCKLDNFPRLIPANVRKKLSKIQEAGIFDEYWILYLDYSGEKPVDTHKEKVAKSKDPILFGKFSYEPSKLYFIADWIDEYCDLTLDKFVEKVKEDDPAYELDKVPEMDENLFEYIKKDAKARHEEIQSRGRITLSSGTPKRKWWQLWKK